MNLNPRLYVTLATDSAENLAGKRPLEVGESRNSKEKGTMRKSTLKGTQSLRNKGTCKNSHLVVGRHCSPEKLELRRKMREDDGDREAARKRSEMVNS